MGSVSQILTFFIKTSTQTPSIYIELDVYARTLDDFVIGRSYGVYSDLERPWLLVINLDAHVENTCPYVGIGTVFFFDNQNSVHVRIMHVSLYSSPYHVINTIFLSSRSSSKQGWLFE